MALAARSVARCNQPGLFHSGAGEQGGVDGTLTLMKDDPRFDTKLRTFLGPAYNLKAIANYETGPGFAVSPERVADANSGQFLINIPLTALEQLMPKKSVSLVSTR